MGWALALNPNNEGNQYISSIDINSQSGNPNPVWNLKFKLSAGNEVSGFYRIAAESIGNVSTNRILLAADLSEIRFYRGTTPKTFSLSGASVDDIFEFDSDGTQLECLVNGVSQGFIAGATGVTLLNFGANFSTYSNMELEYVNYTTTDDANLNRNYDATGSDHNSLILSDITGNDTDGGAFNNMTTANWVNLGGGIIENDETNLTLTDNSTDNVQGGIVEDSVTFLSVLDNSSESITLSQSEITEILLTDSSTDEVTTGINEDEVTFLFTSDLSSDSLILTESDITSILFNDNSTDSFSEPEYSIRIPESLNPVKIAWSLNPDIETVYSSIMIQTTEVVFGINPNTENIIILQDGEDNEH